MARRRNRFINQATLEALVRFGPELSGLREIERQAIAAYRSGVQQAHGTGRGIVGMIDQTRPGVRKIYDDAGISASRHANMLSSDVAALPGVANSIKAGAQLEGTHALAALRDAQAAALTDLGSRRVAAKEGEAFAVNKAHTDLVDTLAQVLGRKQALRREQGAFTALTAGNLRQAAQERADNLSLGRGRIRAQERGQTLSHRDRVRQQNLTHADRVAARNNAAKKKSGYGPNGQSQAKHAEWASDIDSAVQAASRWRGLSRSEIVKKLAQGRPARTVLVDKNGHPLPEGLTGAEKVKRGAHKVTLPGIKAIAPDLRLSAALDIATSGYVGHKTVQRLRARGFSVKQLGLPTRPPRSHFHGTHGG
jgi:hypothetical protein